jgi:hypothetical protein
MEQILPKQQVYFAEEMHIERTAKPAFESNIADSRSEKFATGVGVAIVTPTSSMGFTARKLQFPAGMEFCNTFIGNRLRRPPPDKLYW